jgi:peptidoglycan/xylan/chitin deacetylase (PgdA/CDA1 family)
MAKSLRARLSRVLRPPLGVVLAYHRVADLSIDPQLLAVSEANFRSQMAVLQERFEVVSVRHLIATAGRVVHSRTRRAQVAITFDDGYADNLVNAAPVLAAAGLPATFFVTAVSDPQNHRFWWDALQRVMLEESRLPERLECQVGNARIATNAPWDEPSPPQWDVTSQAPPTRRQATYLRIHSSLRAAPPAEIDSVIEKLCNWAGVEPSDNPRDRLLTTTELAELGSMPNLEIGSHTVSHPMLRLLPVDAQRWELAESRRRLATYVEQDVVLVSFPFGGLDAVGRVAYRLAREVGYEGALTTWSAPIRALQDPYAIPRLTVRNWPAQTLTEVVETTIAGDARAE